MYIEGSNNWRLHCINASEELPGRELKRSNDMDRMLVVVFDAESKAWEAKKGLHELDREDVIAVYDQAVVARNADGSASVRQIDGPIPVRTLAGTVVGAIIGLIGGPVGIGLGAAVGLAAGAAIDVDDARICEDFVEDVREKLTPEKFALVAEINEDSTTAVDTRMEALGGTVFRRALKEVKRTFHDDNVAAMKADRAQLKAERAKAQTDRKVKLQEKINELDSKIQARLERSKQRRQAAEAQEKAKVEFLKARAAVMKAQAPKKHVGPPA
jgi:uncharacterized membrane protein